MFFLIVTELLHEGYTERISWIIRKLHFVGTSAGGRDKLEVPYADSVLCKGVSCSNINKVHRNTVW